MMLRAREEIMALITNKRSTAEHAPAKVAGKLRPDKTVLLNGQAMEPYSELHQRSKHSRREIHYVHSASKAYEDNFVYNISIL